MEQIAYVYERRNLAGIKGRVFEPGDGVDDLMPRDSSVEAAQPSTRPDASGALWCASSAAAEPIPLWSPRRAGRRGGVRFKRIILRAAKAPQLRRGTADQQHRAFRQPRPGEDLGGADNARLF